MICRGRHGWTGPVRADPYEWLLGHGMFVGIAARRIPGSRGIEPPRRDLGEVREPRRDGS